MDYWDAKERAEKALFRRFGTSICPAKCKRVSDTTIRATDIETGSWIEADFSGHRLRVLAEHDWATE